jgi:hypothetical protein
MDHQTWFDPIDTSEMQIQDIQFVLHLQVVVKPSPP